MNYRKKNCISSEDSSTTLALIQASSKQIEGCVYSNLSDNREEVSPNYKSGDFVRTGEKKNNFSTGDTTNWSHKLSAIAEIVTDIIPSDQLIG